MQYFGAAQEFVELVAALVGGAFAARGVTANDEAVINEAASTLQAAGEARLAEIAPTLPPGVTIEAFYDRSNLVGRAVGTVAKALLEAIVLVVLLLLAFLGNLRAALVVALMLPLSALATFILMRMYGLSANLMSLGGLAIAIGLMVDGSVVVVENAFLQLGRHAKSGESQLRVILRAVVEVATPVIFGVGIIILVFLPLMTLQGMEGKMFAPLAYTLFQRVLRHDPTDPEWVGRDRFILSCWHSSLTLYVQLYLGGFGLELGDLEALQYANLICNEQGMDPISFGATAAPSFLRACPSSSRRSASPGSKPFFSETKALTTSPTISSGLPMTPASATAGCAMIAFSRSTELIHSPPDLMTSLARSVSRRKPSADRLPTSPVRSQPSLNLAAISATSPSDSVPLRLYDAVIHGPRTSSSPTLSPSHGSFEPSGPTSRPSTPMTSRPCAVA